MAQPLEFWEFETTTIKKESRKKRTKILSPLFAQKINPFKNDFSTLKSYKIENVNHYILTTNKLPILKGGYENRKIHDNNNGNFVNEEKLSYNIARAKSKILELALCNQWEFFFTGTINKDKYNRYNLEKYYSDLAEFIHSYNRNKRTKLEYLFIPEQHEDLAWHIHGFIKGITKKDLLKFDKMINVPIDLKNKGYYNFEKYRKKFGFCSMGKIKKSEGCAKYMTKYINKSMGETNIKLNSNLFYHSLHLKQYILIGQGTLNKTCKINYSFENDFVKKITFTSSKILQEITNSIVSIP